MLVPFKHAGFDFLLYLKVPAIHSSASTYKFTIDKRPDLAYHCVCYLEQTSPTPRIILALTLGPSITCSLFVVAKKVNSFGINQIQPLFAKHPGVGVPPQTSPLESAT